MKMQREHEAKIESLLFEIGYTSEYYKLLHLTSDCHKIDGDYLFILRLNIIHIMVIMLIISLYESEVFS